MSKARCVNNEGASSYLTVGKVYDALIDNDGQFVVIEDDGTSGSNPPMRFQLLPDEPKAEWMQLSHLKSDAELSPNDSAAFVNVVTGHEITFDNLSHVAYFNGAFIDKQFSDAFAALVGYTFKAGDA